MSRGGAPRAPRPALPDGGAGRTVQPGLTPATAAEMDESIATVAEQLLDRTRAFVREERLPGAAVGLVGRADLAAAARP